MASAWGVYPNRNRNQASGIRRDMAWQRLFARRNDCAFITTMGVDIDTFNAILSGGFAEAWNTTPIPRNDVPAAAEPRADRQSLDAAGALGLVFHHLFSTMRKVSLQEIFGLIPTTINQYLSFASQILLVTLRQCYDARISWPRVATFKEYSELIVHRHTSLWGAFGFIDRLKTRVQESSDPEIENTTYNGWLHEHFINSVLVFAPDGRPSKLQR
ncbi:hypothetical protein OF83DRAFT_1089263 [Amylostereum chailletii]|nr:hypothetical protein OF83DRAFT_1089263 [Amylostereum chailletii]